MPAAAGYCRRRYRCGRIAVAAPVFTGDINQISSPSSHSTRWLRHNQSQSYIERR